MGFFTPHKKLWDNKPHILFLVKRGLKNPTKNNMGYLTPWGEK